MAGVSGVTRNRVASADACPEPAPASKSSMAPAPAQTVLPPAGQGVAPNCRLSPLELQAPGSARPARYTLDAKGLLAIAERFDLPVNGVPDANDHRAVLRWLADADLLDGSRARLGSVPASHASLLSTHVPDSVEAGLRSLHQGPAEPGHARDTGVTNPTLDTRSVTNPFEHGFGKVNFDRYEVAFTTDAPLTVEQMKTMLDNWLINMSATADSARFDMSMSRYEVRTYGSDTPVTSGPLAVGTHWIDIEFGPWFAPINGGGVAIIDATHSEQDVSATVATLTDSGMPLVSENHPVAGRRRFGIRKGPGENNYVLYAVGADNAGNPLAGAAGPFTRAVQDTAWRGMQSGIEANLMRPDGLAGATVTRARVITPYVNPMTLEQMLSGGLVVTERP